jgi:hypothetical protein
MLATGKPVDLFPNGKPPAVSGGVPPKFGLDVYRSPVIQRDEFLEQCATATARHSSGCRWPPREFV